MKRFLLFCFIHHDVWDRDHPAPPNLVTIKQNGELIDAVAQVTKQGYVFVFEQVTGKHLFKMNEVPAPKSNLMGEQTWSTQPVSTKPVPMARQSHTLTEKDISPYAENREELIAQLKTYQTALFAPPSKEGTVILPGYDGGPEWDGAAVDKEGIMYVNCNEMAWILKMKDTPKQEPSFCRAFWL